MFCARNQFSLLDPDYPGSALLSPCALPQNAALADIAPVVNKLQRHPDPHCAVRPHCSPGFPRQNSNDRFSLLHHPDHPGNIPSTPCAFPQNAAPSIVNKLQRHPNPNCAVRPHCGPVFPRQNSNDRFRPPQHNGVRPQLQGRGCARDHTHSDNRIETVYPPRNLPPRLQAPRMQMPPRSNPVCPLEPQKFPPSMPVQRMPCHTPEVVLPDSSNSHAPSAKPHTPVVVLPDSSDLHAPSATPHTPEVVSRTPTDTSTLLNPPPKPRVSLPHPLPHPPGLPRPSGRGRGYHRSRGSARPAFDRGRIDQIMDPGFERYNGPVAVSRLISPPPSGAPLGAVKLPVSRDSQPVPGSPTTTASSLSEELSGSSSVLFSDTTFSTMDSRDSDKVSWHPNKSTEVCRNWRWGRPCYRTPCPFLHEQPNQASTLRNEMTRVWNKAPQLVRPAKQPTLSLTTQPRPSNQQSVHTHDPNSNSIPQRHDPPSRTAEPPPPPPPPLPKPEPLYTTTIFDHIKVRFDRGFEVREVITGFESRWVHLGNIAGTVTSAQLSELLTPYNVDTVNLPEGPGKSVTAKIQFASVADAIRAVTDLNGTELAQRTINAKLAINNSKKGATVLTDTDVQLQWQCPFRVGYAGYDTLKEAKVAIDSLNGSEMEYLVVSAQLYEGIPCIGAYNVIFQQLPAAMTEQRLRKFANANSVMLGHANYQSLDKAVNYIRSRLEEYGTVANFDIIPPPYKDGMVKAWARFTSPADACAAQDDFDHRRPSVVGLTFISCRRVLSLSHVLSAASYRKMREDIGWLRWSWQHRFGPSVSIRERMKETAEDDTPAFIRLSSEQPELLSSLKYEFEQLLHGETVTLDKKPLWDDFLVAQAGHAYITEMQARYPGVQIQVQKNRRVISLWGPIVMRHRARQDIVRKVMELKAQQFWKIPLSGKLLGIFCSAELSTLQELLGPENCILDVAERVLVVRGNDLAFRTACKAVQDAQNRQGGGAPSSEEETCPVCFGEAAVPVSLACGHRWCRTCLSGYLISAVDNKTFPLRCLGNDGACTECVPLGLARRLLSAAEFDSVIEGAFWAYVHARPDEFNNCPTPDCTQVYRTTAMGKGAVLQCPSCLVRICAACRIAYHDGLTCAERDVAEDKLFNAWAASHDVKSCPGCRAPIERTEGCNHMTCTRCQTHSCWECLATFPRGQGIYEHMRLQHGGIGL